MVHCVRCSRPNWIFLFGLSSLFLTLITSGHSHGDRPSIEETVRLDVTTFRGKGNVSEQVKFNIGYSKGQVQVNGFPVNRGVTGIRCNMEIWTFDEWWTQPKTGFVSIRLLVQEWPANSTSGVTRITIQEEVIAVDGNPVQQKKTTEVELMVDEKMGLVTYSSSIISLEDSVIYSIPTANDVLVTFPNLPETGDHVPQQTTREYNIRQNTTLDEEPYPGKLPETPIRGEMPASSYKVMCQFAEELRENLCIIWVQCYPVLIDLLQVVVVGVIAAAIVLEVLKIVYPSGEQKGILSSSDIKESPMLVPLILQDTEKMDKRHDAENIL
ncbi:glycoprotein integral membrane protein 1 [Pelodytes ibericus]